MTTRIGIDLDGVLCNFVSSFSAKLIGVTGQDKFQGKDLKDPTLYPCWDWPQTHGYTNQQCDDTWDQVKKDPWFWRCLGWLPGLKDLQAALPTLMDHDLYFITNRLGIGCKRQSEEWLKDQGIKNPTVLISPHKGSICAALDIQAYIDDKLGNIESVKFMSPCTHAYLLDQPWNREGRLSNMRVVGSVKEFLQQEGV